MQRQRCVGCNAGATEAEHLRTSHTVRRVAGCGRGLCVVIPGRKLSGTEPGYRPSGVYGIKDGDAIARFNVGNCHPPSSTPSTPDSVRCCMPYACRRPCWIVA